MLIVVINKSVRFCVSGLNVKVMVIYMALIFLVLFGFDSRDSVVFANKNAKQRVNAMRNKTLNKKQNRPVVNVYIELIMSASHEES